MIQQGSWIVSQRNRSARVLAGFCRQKDTGRRLPAFVHTWVAGGSGRFGDEGVFNRAESGDLHPNDVAGLQRHEKIVRIGDLVVGGDPRIDRAARIE